MAHNALRPTPISACKRRFELLEDRRLLALTVLTHGTASEFPAWVYDMGTAIVQHEGTYDTRDQNGDSIADFVQNTRVDLNGVQTSVGTQQAYQDLLLFDWSTQSETPGTADSDEVAGALASLIHDRLAEVDSGVLDLHFIGFGRGALVNMEAIRRLAVDSLSDRIGFIQMTTLDPRSLGDDGVMEADPGSVVDFADTYYQDIPADEPVTGVPLPGALNFHLNDQLSAWSGRSSANPSAANHEEVHDWYHWTIDSLTVSETSTPTLIDTALTVPSTADRTSLYNNYVADLNADGSPDDFAGGAYLGYYFSVAGGGIGSVAVMSDGAAQLFAYDSRRGEMPLYLGQMPEDLPPITPNIAPNGTWNYLSNDSRKLVRSRVSFDVNNQPVVSKQAYGDVLGAAPFFVAMQFRSDGTLLSADLNRIYELNTTDGSLGTVYQPASLPGWDSMDLVQSLAIDHLDNLYTIKFNPFTSEPSKLVRISSGFDAWTELRDLPYDEIASLTVIKGLLYGFRNDNSYFTVNLATLQLVERGAITSSEDLHFASATSLIAERAPVWHNREFRYDVNDDGRVTTSDLLAIVNNILQRGSRTIGAEELFTNYIDVNNDGRVNTSDLLAVVNYLLRPAAPPSASPAVEPLFAQPIPVAPTADRSEDWLAFAIAVGSLDDDADDASLFG